MHVLLLSLQKINIPSLIWRCILLAGLSNIRNSCRSYEHNPHDKENNITYNDESNWLHRNDEYQMQQIAGRLRAVPLPDGHKTQTISTIMREGSCMCIDQHNTKSKKGVMRMTMHQTYMHQLLNLFLNMKCRSSVISFFYANNITGSLNLF